MKKEDIPLTIIFIILLIIAMCIPAGTFVGLTYIFGDKYVWYFFGIIYAFIFYWNVWIICKMGRKKWGIRNKGERVK